MVKPAVARETVAALRRTIAKIEGVLSDRLDIHDARGESEIVVRRQGVPERLLLPTGISRFDAVLGGLPACGMIELLGASTKDCGAVAGFCLALARMLYNAVNLPLIWIGTSDIFREAGRPYAPGLLQRFGIPPQHFLATETGKIADMLWIAEQAASLSEIAVVVVETRGNARQLDLTATRRLHRRALKAGYPIILLRHAGQAEPTAAPLRLMVAVAPAAPRNTVLGPLQGSIGPPAFHVTVSKSRTAIPAAFTLEWNNDTFTFQERQDAEDHGDLVPAIACGTRHEAALRTIVASASSSKVTAADIQPARKQHAANQNARHAG